MIDISKALGIVSQIEKGVEDAAAILDPAAGAGLHTIETIVHGLLDNGQKAFDVVGELKASSPETWAQLSDATEQKLAAYEAMLTARGVVVPDPAP